MPELSSLKSTLSWG